MMNTITKWTGSRIIITDIVIIGAIFVLPYIAHLLPIPLYLIDPMRILLFSGYMIVNDSRNTLLLAMIIPLASYLFSGHPVLPKTFLITIELVSNIVIFIQLNSRYKKQIFLTLFLSVFLSKVIYYILKWIFIKYSVIEGVLFSTGLSIQFTTAVCISIAFALVHQLRKG